MAQIHDSQDIGDWIDMIGNFDWDILEGFLRIELKWIQFIQVKSL